jgi:cytochrome P450 PksS
MDLIDIDLTSAEFNADPYPLFARWRAEKAVHRVALPGKQVAWLVTRYEDALATLKSKQFAKDRPNVSADGQRVKQPWVPRVVRPLTRNMLDLDVPDHTRLRTLVQKAFTPRTIERMRERIQSLTDELLDAIEGRGSMDVIRDYALPLPTTIIAEMLGVPPGERHKFHRWSSAIVASNPTRWGMVKAIPYVISFVRYIRRLVELRRRDPRDDLVSALIEAEEAGDQLSGDELVAMIFLLLVAGHETTVHLIGNGTLALLQHPDQLERLRSEPELIAPGVEEILRYCGPLKVATERYALDGATVAGVDIPRGELVYVALASANRDEEQFADAERLDVARTPNRHLAFGQGIHFCLGAPLARLEARIAFATLLRRTRMLRLAVEAEKLRWQRGLVLRGMKALPVRFSAAGTREQKRLA